MNDTARSALQQVQTGIKDVLAGYETLADRAEPEILPIVGDLKSMHYRHLADLEARLGRSGQQADDGASLRGSVNKAVVALRDWMSTLDRNALSFVRDGEERLMSIYDDAIRDLPAAEDPENHRLLTGQKQEIGDRVRQLPEG